MTDAPWQGDACSLVDAFRSGERSPVEEARASLDAIERSDLNAFCHVDPERTLAAAAAADISKPFGGVPTGFKDLEPEKGLRWAEASLVFKDRVALFTSHQVERLLEVGGVVPAGRTTCSELGGLNVSVSKIYGVTHNPWQQGRTAGGSSGGSCSAVGGGLVTLATAGDGGGSIRIPCGYTGLFGLKGTFGRIPRSPHAFMRPNTVVLGNAARSVRDAARYFDVCAGVHPADPSTLPSDGRWEANLGTSELRGRRVAVIPGLCGVPLDPGVEAHTRAAAAELIQDAGLVQVELEVNPPNLAAQWMIGNMATLLADMGPRWRKVVHELTSELGIGMRLATSLYNLNLAAVAEELRVQANEAMAGAFEQVDFIMAATNPGTAFAAESYTSNDKRSFIDVVGESRAALAVFDGLLALVRAGSVVAPQLPSWLLETVTKRIPDVVNMGGLTIISNIYGNPAASIPAGTLNGLPLGLQVLAPHHQDALLLDLALIQERERPWPLVAPAAAKVLATR